VGAYGSLVRRQSVTSVNELDGWMDGWMEVEGGGGGSDQDYACVSSLLLRERERDR